MQNFIVHVPSEGSLDNECMTEQSYSGISGIYDARSVGSDVGSHTDDETIYSVDEYVGLEQSGEYSSSTEDLTNSLLANRQDFSRLEMEDRTEDLPLLVEAIRKNKTVRDVEVHIEALEGLSKIEQESLALAICSLPELRSLLVYKNSVLFLDGLSHHHASSLQNLRLCKLNISSEDTIDLLASTLESLANLSSLDIGFECVSTTMVLHAILKIKGTYVALKCFRLDYKVQEVSDNNLLDERILLALAENIETSSTIKTLSLPPYTCSDKGYCALINMLKNNFVIERIDYWVRICNLYYPDANEKIDYYLHLNQSGVRTFEENSSGAEIFDFLGTHKDDLDVIFQLFNANPSFVSLINRLQF